MSKEVKKDIEIVRIKYLEEGTSDLGMFVNGLDLIDMSLEQSIEILKENDLIRGDFVVVPKGYKLIDKEDYVGTVNYTFKKDHKFIEVDILFDGDEEEYIS